VSGAHKIIVLEDGEAVGIGTHEELLASCEIYRNIHHSQSGGQGGGV
jgi:ATP-binding cassette subfamily B protein